MVGQKFQTMGSNSDSAILELAISDLVILKWQVLIWNWEQ